MFNDYEMRQKQIAFNISKDRFESMDEFLNRKKTKYKDEKTNYSYIFITISRFISYKEDIWIKNKKTKNISTNFSKDILDNFIFNGKFKSTKINILETKKQNHYNAAPIKINSILEGKENDSIWIIDNIRDSIAHGHYCVDFDKHIILINNNHPDRLFNCEITFDSFKLLNELITEERIGGYTNKKLISIPSIYTKLNPNEILPKSIKNETELRFYLKNIFYVIYSSVDNIKEENDEKKYKDLTDFYNYNVRIVEKFVRKYSSPKSINIGDEYVKEIKKYVNSRMNKYDVTIFNNTLNDEMTNKIITHIKEQPDFFDINLYDQCIILQGMIKTLLSHDEITIEKGLYDILELYHLYELKKIAKNPKDVTEIDDLIFGNINSFRDNKKLANLFILATNNFVSNKEAIYDKYFENYNVFDISNFDYQDYSGYDKLFNKLNNKNEELRLLSENIDKLNNSKTKLNNSLSKAPDNRKYIIQKNIDNLNITLNEANEKIKILINEINILNNNIDLHKNDSNGNYINNNNNNFFTHLRNVFAHGHIHYYDDRPVYNRKIVLEDYDDENNLTFRCICRYYDLVKLLNNELFIEAMTNKENTKEKTKHI